ncbi:MAG: immunity 17 family protein [Bacteroides sp.]|nr:immunity 17 family protein [Bacteroides sp.]MCM1413572.1 immunity 17 family protein [Bacteroides sp.]MCM1471126.1 immunity 17 family protein [Bacteroides sp.]
MTAPLCIMASLFLLAGVVSLLAAWRNWDWFFNSTNVRMLTFDLRRPYCRLLYGVLGLAMIAMGVKLFYDKF